MAKRTPPHSSYPEWTTARFWSFIRSTLRRAWSRWPPKYKVLASAKRECKEKGRQKYEYKCSKCEGYFPQKEIEVDHITPCGSLNDYKDLAGFVERLFVSEEKLRVVCKQCHREITNEHK